MRSFKRITLRDKPDLNEGDTVHVSADGDCG